MEYALSNTHWLDGFTPPLERQFALLARSVNALLGRDVEAIPDPAPAKTVTASGTMPSQGPRASRAELAGSEPNLRSERQSDVPAGSRQKRRAIWLTSIVASVIGLAALVAIWIAVMLRGQRATESPRLSDRPRPADPSKQFGKPRSSFEGTQPKLSSAEPKPSAFLAGPRPTASSAGTKPTIPSPPTDRIPPAGPARRAMSISGAGWSVEGDQLVKEGLGIGRVEFGDDEWTDYDLACEVRKSAGIGWFAAAFRGNSVEGKFYVLKLGEIGNKHSLIGWSPSALNHTELRSTPGAIQPAEWYKVKISLRGPRIHIELNDHLLFALTDESRQKGSISPRCIDSAGRFRNIKVTAPDGAVLWEGPPDVPAPAPTPVPPPQAPPRVEVRKQAPVAPPDPEKDPKLRATLSLEYKEGLQSMKKQVLGMSTNRAAEFRRTASTKLLKELASKHKLEVDQVKRMVSGK
jgi:hypothetical protein